MKEFRIGQRVRVLQTRAEHRQFTGICGTITSALYRDDAGDYVQDLDLDGVPPPIEHPWRGSPEFMEPIDDNTGDWRVIEHVTKWNPYKVNA